VAADVLSRLGNSLEFYNVDEDVKEINSVEGKDVNLCYVNLWQYPELNKSLDELQRKDPQLLEIIRKVQAGEEDNYIIQNRILLQRTKGKRNQGLRAVVPKEMQHTLIDYFHSPQISGSHTGFQKTASKIAARFTWPGMFQDIRSFVTSCDLCQRCKDDTGKKKGTYFSNVVKYPNHTWYVDTIGRWTASGPYEYVFIVTDAASKFVFLEPMRRLSSKAVCDILMRLFLKTGFILKLVHDGASIFCSDYFRHFLYGLGIQDVCTSPRSPSSNISERMIRYLKGLIRAYIDKNQKNWASLLMKISYSINICESGPTGMTPSELYLGRKMYNPLDARWFIDLEILNQRDCKERFNIAAENVMKAWQRKEKLYKMTHQRVSYREGDEVLLRNFRKSSLSARYNAKLDHLYHGPFKVLNMPTLNTVWLESLVGRPYRIKRHVQYVKRYLRPRDGRIDQGQP
jgi:hypothetical protein